MGARDGATRRAEARPHVRLRRRVQNRPANVGVARVIVRQPTQQVKLDHFDSPPTVTSRHVNGALMTVIPSRFSRERFRSLVMDVYRRTGGVRTPVTDDRRHVGQRRSQLARRLRSRTWSVHRRGVCRGQTTSRSHAKNPQLGHESILHTLQRGCTFQMLSAVVEGVTSDRVPADVVSEPSQTSRVSGGSP